MGISKEKKNMGKFEEGSMTKAVWQLITESKNFDKKHALHVTDLSILLFNQLKQIHGMGIKELEILKTAAMLHDIGWKYGGKRHHKSSRDIIISSPFIASSEKLRAIIGLIARYHRKSMPKPSHKYFCNLDECSKKLVIKLAALLRFADGLDSSHKSPVKAIKSTISKKQIIVHILTTNLKGNEIETGKLKSDLLTVAFNRTVELVFLQEQLSQE